MSNRQLPTHKARQVTSLDARRFPPVTVADLMSRQVIAIEESSSVAKVCGAMDEYRFRHLPVIDDMGKVVGLLSHRDLMRAEPSSLAADHDAQDAVFKATTTVDAIMRRDVITVAPDELLSKAAQMLLEHNIGSLPVVRGGGSLVGIVTKSDFVRLALALMQNPQA